MLAEDGLITENRGTLVVTLDTESVGDVQWHAVVCGPGTGVHALNIGICLRSGGPRPRHRL